MSDRIEPNRKDPTVTRIKTQLTTIAITALPVAYLFIEAALRRHP